MTITAEQLLEQVMALDENDLSEFFGRLSKVFESSDEPEYLAAWGTELKTRIDDIDSGRAKMIPAAETVRMIRKQAGCDDQAG